MWKSYYLEIESTLYLLATTHKILYVNVAELIKKQYDNNTPLLQKLKNTYAEKRLLKDKSRCNSNELIYYDYNPIHYNDKVVVEMTPYDLTKGRVIHRN